MRAFCFNKAMTHQDLRLLLGDARWSALQQRSLARGLWALAVNWGLIAAAFAGVARWPGVPSVLVALVVLGGRQLGLGILMHDCAHRSLFPSAALNDRLGQWLCAAPVFADLAIYRRYHMTHHVKAGTEEDPDLPNYSGYPVSRASLARKLWRDLSGRTGLKAVAALAILYSHADPHAVQLGYSYRRGSAQGERSLRHLLWNLRRILAAQALLAALLWALGHPALYLLWPLAWLSPYMAFSRIRNAAEHGGLPGTLGTDIWTNTRSVRARWWERLTVAPNHVNWHFEHHLAPTVPGYRLQALHQALNHAGLPRPSPLAPGYGAVLRDLVRS
jgi:fatty acid desaturase